MRLIDADELKDFFFSETSGTEETIRDLMMQHNLDYANDVNEDEVMDFAKELLKKVRNVIDTEPTAYDIDKVVEGLEREKDIHTEHFNNSIYKDMPEIKQRYSQALGIIDKAIEIVKQQLKENK